MNIYAKGNNSNPIHKFMRTKKEVKDNYWLAICAGARKLLVIIWYMLKNNTTWGHVKTPPEVRTKLGEIVKKKIKVFESKTNRYEKILERLNIDLDLLIEGMDVIDVDPGYLLHKLLKKEEFIEKKAEIIDVTP